MLSFSQADFIQTSTEDFRFGVQENVITSTDQVQLATKAVGVGVWSSTGNLPINLSGHKMTTWNDDIFLVGGHTGSSYSDQVYRALTPTQGLISWDAMGTLPVAVKNHELVATGKHLYVIGGDVNGTATAEIYSAEINELGNIFSWHQCNTSLPAGLASHTATYVNGYMYIAGGSSLTSGNTATSAVYVAQVLGGGDLSSFTATTSLPAALSAHTAFAYDGKLFIVGGKNNSGVLQSQVYYSTVGADGSCGPWASAGNFPTGISNHATVCSNGMATVISGDIGGSVPLSRKAYTCDLSNFPILTWTMSSNELTNRRKDGQVVCANDQLIFTGGEELSGLPNNETRISLLSMATQLCETGTFISNPFFVGSEKNIVSYSYQLQSAAGAGSTAYYRLAGFDGEWGNWINAGLPTTVSINQSQSYLQYRFHFTSNGLTNVTLLDASINVSGFTELAGDISSIDTFYVANSPYWATEDISLTSGNHYVEPGVTFMFSENARFYIGQAGLFCDGNSTDSIVFTFEGEANGMWDGIFFSNNSDIGVTSTFNYTRIEKAGGLPENANLVCHNTNQPHLNHCTIANANGNGIVLEDSPIIIDFCTIESNTENGINLSSSNPVINNCHIYQNGHAGVYHQTSSSVPVFNQTIIEENGVALSYPTANRSFTQVASSVYTLINNNIDIEMEGGTITFDKTWEYFENGYAILENVDVMKSGDMPELTIAAGNTLRFAPGSSLHIGFGSSTGGQLKAIGTITNPITFTALNDSIGGWDGLYFDNGSDFSSASSLLKYCNVEKANDYNLYAHRTSQPTILYSRFTDAAGYGVSLYESSISIEETNISNNQKGMYVEACQPSMIQDSLCNNTEMAIWIESGTPYYPLFLSCVVENSEYGIYFDSPSMSMDASAGGVSFNNVTYDYAIPGGTITSSVTWDFEGLNATILDDITIMDYSNPVLSIAPGSTLKFKDDVNVFVGHTSNSNSYRGGISAIGTASQPITFTSENNQIDGWEGFVFYTSSDYNGASSLFRNCTIENAFENIFADYSDSILIDSCIIRNAYGHGMRLLHADITITNSSISNNGHHGISNFESYTTLSDLEFNNNTHAAIHFNSIAFTDDMTNISTSGNESGINIGGGNLATDAIWEYTEQGYCIEDDISVYGNDIPILTIDPGVTVHFQKDVQFTIAGYDYNTSQSNSYRGGISAIGQSNNPITFTADNDSVGGWDGLVFASSADYNGATSTLRNCVIEKAMLNVTLQSTDQPLIDSSRIASAYNGGITCNYSNPTIANCVIEDNGANGIFSFYGSPYVTDNNIVNNGFAAISYYDANYVKNISNLYTAGNSSGIKIQGGTISENINWVNTNQGYHITGNISVYGANLPILSIEPGVSIYFDENVQLAIAGYGTGASESNSYLGGLNAIGHSINPITFTSTNGNSNGWEGLIFANSADYNGSESTLRNCIIEKAEFNVTCQSTTQPLIDSCLIADAYASGIKCNYSDITVSNSTIKNNGVDGIFSYNASPFITNDSILNNNYAAIEYYDVNDIRNINNLHTDGNGSGIKTNGGTITSDATWVPTEQGYLVKGDITIAGNDIPELTLQPGVEIALEPDVQFYVSTNTSSSNNSYRGNLNAIGTANKPIIFTAAGDSAGGWDGIKFSTSSDYNGASSTLKNCIIKNAKINITCVYTDQPFIDSCIISNSSEFGIRSSMSAISINNSQIINNEGTGLRCNNNPPPTIRKSLIAYNEIGVYLYGDNIVIGGSIQDANDFYYNNTYDIYNDGWNSIDARYNFFNTLDPVLLEERIYDVNDEAAKGLVDISNYTATGIYPMDNLQMSGSIKYGNTQQSPVASLDLYRLDYTDQIVETISSTASGNYSFNTVHNGYHKFDGSNDDFGGVNSTDALLIMQHFTNLNPLNGLNLDAADVNASNTVNSTDALFAMKRFANLIDTFPAGSWCFLSDSIQNIRFYHDSINTDLTTLCYGDVNASFNPSPAAKGLNENNIQLHLNTELWCEKGMELEIPISIQNHTELAAVSLAFDINCRNIEIVNIQSVLGENAPLVWSVSNDQLFISWFKLEEVKVTPGDALFKLQVRVTDELDNQQMNWIELNPARCELTGLAALPIANIKLEVPHLQQQLGGFYLGQNMPNPFKEYSTINYYIPEAGQTMLSICDLFGKEVMQLQNIYQESGNYSFTIKANDLPAGVYIYKLLFEGETMNLLDAKRMTIQK